jgi:6-hydroxy-3-succinoylpyridine 3-monooxygenase
VETAEDCPVLRTEGEILKWARKENAHAGSRRPIGLIETDAGAVEVFDYIDGYILNQLDKAGDQDDLSSRS